VYYIVNPYLYKFITFCPSPTLWVCRQINVYTEHDDFSSKIPNFFHFLNSCEGILKFFYVDDEAKLE
jgi:hypothetical protein